MTLFLIILWVLIVIFGVISIREERAEVRAASVCLTIGCSIVAGAIIVVESTPAQTTDYAIELDQYNIRVTSDYGDTTYFNALDSCWGEDLQYYIEIDNM